MRELRCVRTARATLRKGALKGGAVMAAVVPCLSLTERLLRMA
jgi:hypothetical protein